MKNILEKQRDFFSTRKSKEYDFRVAQLKKLLFTIERHENEIEEALNADLNKSPAESYMTEIFIVKEEIAFMLKNLKSMMKPRRVSSPISIFPSSSKIYPEPLGVALIIAPWNYPFQLALAPLVAAIASGNCAVIKPSEYSTHTSEILKKLIKDAFDENYITVITGGVDVGERLLDLKFDHIFFTGSTNVGKIVMKKAAEHLTPVTLELGGKSPVIVCKDANIKRAAKRIMWGKCLNSSQTCVAPDHAFVHNSIKDSFINECKEAVIQFFGYDMLSNPQYPKIIDEKHFERLTAMIEDNRQNIVYGGASSKKELKIETTFVSLDVTKDDMQKRVMQEEIFGPILPIIAFNDIRSVIAEINSRPKALSLYLFTESDEIKSQIINSISFGGGCINDTVMHLANSNLPFGGVGESGMGVYHGKYGFDTFTHYKSMISNTTLFDIPLRFAPYKLKLIKMFMK